MYCISQVIKYTWCRYIGGRMYNTSICAIQVIKVDLKPTVCYTLTAPLKLKVGVRLTSNCQPKHEGVP